MRRAILKLLYDDHVDSGRPKKYQILELKRKIKDSLGFTPAEVQHNLEYLIQNGFILKKREPYPGPQSQRYGTKKTVYKLSTKAMDLFEGESPFSVEGTFGGIVIHGDSNIVQLGYGNVANIQYQDLYRVLEDLKQGVKISEDLPDDEKIYVVSDITAIQTQLVRSDPDRTFLNKLLNRVRETIALGGGLASLMNAVMRHWPF